MAIIQAQRQLPPFSDGSPGWLILAEGDTDTGVIEIQIYGSTGQLVGARTSAAQIAFLQGATALNNAFPAAVREAISAIEALTTQLQGQLTAAATPAVQNNAASAQPNANLFQAVLNDGTGPGAEGTWYVLGPSGQTPVSGLGRAAAEAEAERLNAAAAAVPTSANAAATAAAAQAAAVQQTLTQQLQAQATRAAQRKQANEGDWRVKLRLAENSNYLYRDPKLDEQGILWPLTLTNGVIFPYTPTISTSYNANYTDQALTHSNYKGYFYQSSHVGEISIQAQFTAQDTTEANYLLAVIHFFRSVTKMFYGQDAQRGAPPPLVFLQGLGEMQFNLHPCVVSQFQYSLPADVDYIRARTTNIAGAAQNSLLFRRARQTTPATPADAKNTRLSNSGLQPGARSTLPGPGTLGQGSATQGPTYVPTKMEMTLTLLPMQTRLQQSQEFSVRDFANGNLQRGGFW
jgi:hypothetical protein